MDPLRLKPASKQTHAPSWGLEADSFHWPLQFLDIVCVLVMSSFYITSPTVPLAVSILMYPLVSSYEIMLALMVSLDCP